MQSVSKTPFFKRRRVQLAMALVMFPLGMVIAKVSNAVAEHYELGLLAGLLASAAVGLTAGFAVIGVVYVVWIRREDQTLRG